MVAGYRRVDGQGWKVIGAGVAEHCTSLGICSLGGFQILVGDVDLCFESVQLRVLKYLPPVAAELLVAGLGRLPIADFFIGWRNFRRGALIGLSNGAKPQEEEAQGTRNGSDCAA